MPSLGSRSVIVVNKRSLHTIGEVCKDVDQFSGGFLGHFRRTELLEKLDTYFLSNRH